MTGVPPSGGPVTTGRSRCWRCRLPRLRCVCPDVARVANRTEVVILQHRRERDHPLGTARLARLGLERVRLVETAGVVARPSLPAGAALLYPATGAPEVGELPPDARPSALVVLDGTWHHAHRLYADNPWLRELPAVRLDPGAPSRYRLRRQARPEHVSTIESVVEALTRLEPETAGLDGLCDAFERMIDRQLELMGAAEGPPRFQRRRPRAARAVPLELLDHPERVVVAYGETAPLRPGRPRQGRQLVSWVGWRPATGEVFERLVTPTGAPPSDEHLAHMDLVRTDLADAAPLHDVATAWRAFVRDDDLVLAWNAGRVRMLRALDRRGHRHHQLKALWCNVTQSRCGTLDELVEARALEVVRPPMRGRAALRVGQATAVARELVRLAPRVARVRQAPSPL